VEAFGSDGTVVALVEGTVREETDFPGVAYAATAASAPMSATALPANQRVVFEMRRRPASRFAAPDEPIAPPSASGVDAFQASRRVSAMSRGIGKEMAKIRTSARVVGWTRNLCPG
jgi:hypothetical protein